MGGPVVGGRVNVVALLAAVGGVVAIVVLVGVGVLAALALGQWFVGEVVGR